MHSITSLKCWRRSAGFSIVELMVALVLGLFVLAGLIDIFIASNRAYQLQAASNFLQENMRIVSARLGASLRMADFWGGNKATSVDVGTTASVIKGRGRCDGGWVTAVTSDVPGGGGIRGYEGASSFPFDSGCIGGAANYVAGSDVLVVRHADAEALSSGPLPPVSSVIASNPKQLFVVAAPGVSAQLFSGGVVPKAMQENVRRYAYAYRLDMYYLRPCFVLALNASSCSAASDGGAPLPTLMHLGLQSDGTLLAEPIVEGIEQLKFEYAVVDQQDGAPRYLSANDLSSAQWARVTAVRVSVVAVDATRDVAVPHIATFTLGTLNRCSYSISATGSAVTGCGRFVPYGADRPWQFMRTSQQFVVQLRNRGHF